MHRMMPGERLKHCRQQQGYTRKTLCKALMDAYMPIEYQELGRLERSETSPTFYEIDAVRKVLGLSADCWISGICNPLSDEVNAMTQFLNNRQLIIMSDLLIAGQKALNEPIGRNKAGL